MKILTMLATATMMCATPALAQGFPNPHNPNIQVGGNGGGNNGCGNGNGGNSGTGCGPNTPDTPPVTTPGPVNGGAGIGIGVGLATSTSTSTSGALSSSTATGGNSSAVGTGGNSTAVGTGGSVGNTTATGGNATGGVAVATVGNTSATGGNVGNTSATGGQGGNATGGASGGNTLSNVTNYRRAFRQAPMAYAPSMIAGECQRSVSFGISTPVGGISHGKTKANKFCELVKLRSVAADMSLSGQMQCAILAQDKRWARAMKASGETCAAPVVITPSTVITDTSVIEAGENG